MKRKEKKMGRERKNLSPTYTELIIPTYDALKQLGGSGTNLRKSNCGFKFIR